MGVEGPYSLKPVSLPDYRDREVTMTFVGVGAEGVKTSLETTALIYAEQSGTGHTYVQSGARYGAARKGAAIFMNLRISPAPILNSSQTSENDVVVFFNEIFLSGQILTEYVGGLKEHGLLVVNTPRSVPDLLASFPPQMQEMIEKRRIRVITIDATRAALHHLNRNLPGAALLGLINSELGILPEHEFEERFTAILEKKVGSKKGHRIKYCPAP